MYFAKTIFSTATVECKHTFCQHYVVTVSTSRYYLPKLIRQTLISWVKRVVLKCHSMHSESSHTTLFSLWSFDCLKCWIKSTLQEYYAPLMCATRTMWFVSVVKSMMKYDLIKVVTVLDAVHSLPSPWGPNPLANNDVSPPLSVRVFSKS